MRAKLIKEITAYCIKYKEILKDREDGFSLGAKRIINDILNIIYDSNIKTPANRVLHKSNRLSKTNKAVERRKTSRIF